MVKEAQKLLSEIARTIDKFPDELPEDFINQEAAVKSALETLDDEVKEIIKVANLGDDQKANNYLEKCFASKVRP